MDGSVPNKIYPACSRSIRPSQSFANGLISSIPNNERQCDIAGYNCKNYKDMQPPTTKPNGFPITWTLTNDPINNLFSISFDSATYSPIFDQRCNFMSTAVPTASGLKVYIGGNNNADSLTIQSFDIEAYSETQSPTRNPITSSPTKSPSPSPSRQPTKKPTNFPSLTPSKSPSFAPSYSPSDAPSSAPSYSPTDSPTFSPIKAPTGRPSQPPSDNPSRSPISAPSFAPTSSPTAFPSNAPVSSP